MTGNASAKPQAQALKPKPVPQRTCIACRLEQGKRAFIRIVRTPEGRVIIDHSGKSNGRGAYLCPEQKCWVKALKGSTISNALKITPAREDVEALRAFGTALPAVEGGTLVHTNTNPGSNAARRPPGGADGEGTR